MFISEYFPEEEAKILQENKVTNTIAKDNLIEISVNLIETIFYNINTYISQVIDFYKKN
jgi:hypothetical protein